MSINNNFYSIADFAETLSRVNIKKNDIEEVVKAWGDSNGSDKEGGTDLHLCVLLKLKDGQHALIEGWNDYTGWGCQDGVEVKKSSDQEELLKNMAKNYFDEIIWDEKPVDLNEWIHGKRKLPDWYEEANY